MFFLKRSLILCITIYFSFGLISPAYSYTEVTDYLCELAVKYYEEGNYPEALKEFKKVLVVNPGNKQALEYIDLIDQIERSEPGPAQQPETEQVYETPRVSQVPQVPEIPQTPEVRRVQKIEQPEARQQTVDESLNRLEDRPQSSPAYFTPQQSKPKFLALDERLKDIRTPVEVEKDKTIILVGENITRFLDTVPNIVRIEKLNENEISVKGYDYGYTYVHVWDNKARWTIEFLCVPPRPEGLSLADELRQSAESAGSFKFRYSLDWNTLETGRDKDNLKRTSYSWNHWLTLDGQTPYGDLDSQASVRTVKETTDLTYFTIGLDNGKLGNFKDFSLRGFDFTPEVSNLVFSSPSLRGFMLESPAFNKKLDYTIFWGREGGGNFGGLSPGLSKIRDSFLEGVSLEYSPQEKQLLSFSAFHGSGEDRSPDLNSNGYDFEWEQTFANWKHDYEVAYDSENLAHLFTTTYSLPNFRISTELRDTAKAFHTMTGSGWRAGEIGALTNMAYKPVDNLEINSRLDIFQDRLFPNPKNDDWLNEDFNIDANYAFNQWSSFRTDYSLQNELGRISPIRYHNAGAGFYQNFDWIRRFNTYVTYRHQDSRNFNAHANDFINEKILLGMRTELISYLYYYANKEFNWLNALESRVRTRPNAFETGIDWNHQIFNSLFYGDFRLAYRNEEDTASPVSYLSGEDYWEGYAEISYRPRPGFETYCSGRLRQIWSDNPNVPKRVDASIFAGLRYTWDTGVHWNPVGTIKGHAFKDYNYDGLRQADEPAVEGVKVFLGKDRSQVTDSTGEYRFTKVRAKKAFVSLDTTTIPAGFVLTTPVNQEAMISQAGVVEVNFGLASRTEISGIIFEDTNNNGKFDGKDKGIKSAEVFLEDGTKQITNESGRYNFSKAKAGKHTLKLNLNSLPSNYMPTVPILEEIDLTEGATYIYNIPLKNIPE
jgi:hypothetical protein